MDIYAVPKIAELIKGNPYVGRGIVLGKSQDGEKAVAAYFIMGRSENSRNRIFTEREGSLYTAPFDPSKVEDPSLIIYAAMKKAGNKLIVTNGDQTDTVLCGLQNGLSFSESLKSRCFEPDAPHFTPRISGMITFKDNDCSYEMSILKSADRQGSACNRFTFSYAATPGVGHFLHTYMGDGCPLPSFCGEPCRVEIPDDPDGFTDGLWNALHPENRISLYVRYVSLLTGKEENRLINKNQRGL
ncbi:MAG: IMP cyclohydrolase [Clostridia bacterium]|nr:IMP cyclohydrolase [Clostridia bacterium]